LISIARATMASASRVPVQLRAGPRHHVGRRADPGRAVARHAGLRGPRADQRAARGLARISTPSGGGVRAADQLAVVQARGADGSALRAPVRTVAAGDHSTNRFGRDRVPGEGPAMAKKLDGRSDSCGEFADVLRETLGVEPYDPF